MRITGLQIDQFGIWSQVQFDGLADGVTVFYGPNEAGKTTLLQFIRMVLYGFDAGRVHRYLESNRQGMLAAGRRIGGSLVLSTRDDDYHIRRYASQRNPTEDLIGDLRVTTRDGNRQGGHRLMNLLSGVDETVYNNVFAVGLRELQYLGTLNDTQASRYLYNLSTGTDRVSLVDVMRQLQTARGHLIGDHDSESLLAQLILERNEIAQQLTGMAGSLERWAQQRGELEQLDEEMSRIEAGGATLERRIRHLELAARVEPVWRHSCEIEQQIQALGMIPAISEDTQRELNELASQISLHEQQLHDLQQQRAAAAPSQVTSTEDGFLHHVVRIEAILEDHPTVAALDDQLNTLRQRLEETEFDLQAELERLGLVGHEANSAPQFDEQVLAVLQSPAERVEAYREQLEQAKQESARLKAEAGRVADEMADALGRDKEWLERLQVTGLERGSDTRNLVGDLRRRLQIERKGNACREAHRQLQARQQSLLASQLLPWEVIQALGALFAVGSVCLAVALIGGAWGFTDRSRLGLTILGLVAVLSSGLLKLVLSGSTQGELQDCVTEIDELGKQLAELEQEAATLDKRIPAARPGGAKGSSSSTIESLQQRLLKVEALMPLDGRRRALQEASAAYEQRAVQLAHRLKDARDHWAESLRHFGLAADLTPSQIRQLARDAGRLAQLNEIATQLRAQITDTQRELGKYSQRMTALCADLRLVPQGERVLEQLQQLRVARQQHEERLRQMEKRREAARQLRDREQAVQRALRQLVTRRAACVAAQGAIDDDNLQQLIQRRRHWEQLVQQRETRRDELTRLLPDKATQKAVFAELLSEEGGSVTARLDAVRANRQRGEARIKEVWLRRGEVAERCRQMADDRSLADKRLELAQVDARLAAAVEQTQIIHAITQLLRQVYKRYEKDRQPETLKEASLLLRRMTQGKYTRIWTPLDQDALFVDEPGRLSIPVDQLSRGTREQLFLALRLALVSGYARRGCHLPLVLDDVLVNFDEGRTRAAAEVLMDVGHAGHQVLIFTCHEHVMQMFGDLGADVRRLPIRSRAGEPDREVRVARTNRSAEKFSRTSPSTTKKQRGRHALRTPLPAAHATQFEIGYGDADPEDFILGFEGPPRVEPDVRLRTQSPDTDDGTEFPGDWDAPWDAQIASEHARADSESDLPAAGDRSCLPSQEGLWDEPGGHPAWNGSFLQPLPAKAPQSRMGCRDGQRRHMNRRTRNPSQPASRNHRTQTDPVTISATGPISHRIPKIVRCQVICPPSKTLNMNTSTNTNMSTSTRTPPRTGRTRQHGPVSRTRCRPWRMKRATWTSRVPRNPGKFTTMKIKTKNLTTTQTRIRTRTRILTTKTIEGSTTSTLTKSKTTTMRSMKWRTATVVNATKKNMANDTSMARRWKMNSMAAERGRLIVREPSLPCS